VSQKQQQQQQPQPNPAAQGAGAAIGAGAMFPSFSNIPLWSSGYVPPELASTQNPLFQTDVALAGTPGANSIAAAPAAQGWGGGVGAGGIMAGGITGALQASGAVKTFQDGKNLSGAEQAALFLPTMGMSPLINPIKKRFGSGKGKAQRERDVARQRSVAAGLFDKDYNLTFSDGVTVNMGLDGGATYTTPSGKELKVAYENDWDNPMTSFVAGALNPLGTIMSQGKGRGITSQLVNAVVANSKTPDEAYNRVREIYSKAGLDFNSSMSILQQMHKEGKLDDSRALADQVSLDMTFNNPNKTKAVNIPYGQDRPLSQGVGAATPQTGTSAKPMPTQPAQPQVQAPTPSQQMRRPYGA